MEAKMANKSATTLKEYLQIVTNSQADGSKDGKKVSNYRPQVVNGRHCIVQVGRQVGLHRFTDSAFKHRYVTEYWEDIVEQLEDGNDPRDSQKTEYTKTTFLLLWHFVTECGVGDDTDSMCLLVMWLLCTQGAGAAGVVWVLLGPGFSYYNIYV